MSYYKCLLFIMLINSIINLIEEDYEINTKLGNFYELNDYTFKDLVLNISSNNSWLLIFYDIKCRYSKGSLINLKRSILKYYHQNKTLKFGIINTNNKNTSKLIYRFKVKRVPYITFIHNNKMYPYTQLFTPGRLIEFIANLNLSNYEEIPKVPFEQKQKYSNKNKNKNKNINIIPPQTLSFFEQSKLNFIEFINSLNEPMQIFLNKYSINIQWTNNKTYLLYFFFVLLIIPIEYYMIKFIIIFFQKNANENIKGNENGETKGIKLDKSSIKKIKDVNEKEKID